MAAKKKPCKVCGEAKTLDHFGKVSKNKDGLDNWCRKCSQARKAELKKTKGKPGSTRPPKTLADGKPAAPNGAVPTKPAPHRGTHAKNAAILLARESLAKAKKLPPPRTDPKRHAFKQQDGLLVRCGICGQLEVEHTRRAPAAVLDALAQINRNIAAAEAPEPQAKPARKALTREQKDAANDRAKTKRDEAREMRSAAMAARS